jgi:succinate dehydrogenase / fumarate reductase flavoprotein subunit
MKHTLAWREDDGSIRLGYKEVESGKYLPMERKY